MTWPWYDAEVAPMAAAAESAESAQEAEADAAVVSESSLMALGECGVAFAFAWPSKGRTITSGTAAPLPPMPD